MTKRLIEPESLEPVRALLHEREPRNRLFLHYLDGARLLVDDAVRPSVAWALTDDYPFPMLEARTPADLRAVAHALPIGKDLAFVGQEFVPILVAHREAEVTRTIIYDLSADVSVPAPETELPPLRPDLAEYVAQTTWNAPEYAEYMRARIERWPSVAVYEGGNPIAWALCHSPDCMGALHVLPEHRRKGLARLISLNLIKRLRAQGRRPCTQVFEHNSASRALCEGLGMIDADRVAWIWFRGVS